MSSKSTIAYYQKSGYLFHVYSELFSDLIRMEIDLDNNVNIGIELPLPFVMELSDALAKHVAPIRAIMNASDEELRAQAKEYAIKAEGNPFLQKMRHLRLGMSRDDGHSLETLEHDRYQELKALQTQYRKDNEDKRV